MPLASGPGRAIVQMRGSNPYAAGGGVTSHHIVPHSTLMATLGKLTAPQRIGVLRTFLPAFGSLTMETLINSAIQDPTTANYLELRYNGVIKTQHHIANDNPAGFAAVARKPFANLTAAEKLLITVTNWSGAAVTPFATFDADYTNLANGVGGAPTTMQDALMEVFFEWQSGNQFYASARYEPGTSDDFDYDAKYVLGNAQYVSDLADVSKALKKAQAGGALSALEQTQLVATFTTLAGRGTAGRAIPALDESLWFYLNTDEKEALLESLEGYNRVTASGVLGARKNTYKVPKDVVRDGYKHRKKAKGDKADWRQIFLYLKNSGNTGRGPLPGTVVHPLCRAWQIEATNGKYLGIQGTTVKVLVNQGVAVTMEDIWSALDDLFEIRCKEVFDFLR